jgi:hypothetical protein
MAEPANQVLPPIAQTVEVDFCRGPSGAFLAVDNLVVAGDCTGGGRTIQSFVVARTDLERALAPRAPVQSVARPPPPTASDRGEK